MKSEKTKSIFKQIISLFISICIIGQSASTFAMQTPKQQREEFIEYLQEEQDRYKKLFDQESLLEELDYDADNIIDFVTNKIVYQAYNGVLRGAKGTLIGRAGNSHDQAITLVGMLKDAGFEAEILVGKLTEEQATELNLTIASPQFSELKDTISSSKSVLAKKIAAKAEELVKTEGESISTLMKETDALAERVFNQIPKEQINKGMEAFKASVQNSAISYRWVRYRLSQGKKWIGVHPAYADAKKWNLKPESFEKKSVNPEDLQQFSVEVWIENSTGEKKSITGLWKKPAANLLDHTLSIDVVSDATLKIDLLNQKEEVFKQSRLFFVQINGKLAKEGKAFDLNGNIYSGDSLSGLNSVFSTLNKKTQEVADSLSSLSIKNTPKANSKKQLTKMWLEFTLDKPNAENKSIKRVIFDGKALADTSKTAARLLQRWDINIATTTPMQQYYQSEQSNQIVKDFESIEKLQKYFKDNTNAKQSEVYKKLNLATENPNAQLLSYKRSIFDRFEPKNEIASYIHEPNILAIRHGNNSSNGNWRIYKMTDIVSNNRWSLKVFGQDIIPTPLVSISHGVWETRTESASTSNSKNTAYSHSAFEQLANEESFRIKKINETPNINIEEGIGTSWWGVDFKTGSTVGMSKLEQGIGGEASFEYANQLSFNTVFSMVAFGIGAGKCTLQSGDLACCLVTNAVTAAVGGSFGLVLATHFAKITVSLSSLAFDTVGLLVSLPCDS